MADAADLILDERGINATADKLIRQYLSAGTRAVSTTARDLEKDLEAATQRAVPGKLYRAWQSSTCPRTGPARNPVGTVWLKGRADGRTGGAIKFWSQPGAIRGKAGQYLALIRYRGKAPEGAAAPVYGYNYTLTLRVLEQ